MLAINTIREIVINLRRSVFLDFSKIKRIGISCALTLFGRNLSLPVPKTGAK